MDYNIIAGPVIGAIIGYCTNYIAIKMMFRPFEAKKIGKFKVPFTPGIIPRRKESMAKAIGRVVEENLLNEDTVKNALLSDEVKNQIKAKIEQEIGKHREDERTIEDIILNYVDGITYIEEVARIEEKLSEKVKNKLLDIDVGEIFSEKVVEIIQEKMNSNFILNKFTGKVTETIKSPIKNAINKYFEEDGVSFINPAVKEGMKSVTGTTVGKIVQKVEKSGVDISDVVIKIYEDIINEKIKSILSGLKIGEIIENRIKNMHMIEVEALILKTIKKELNAVVNLGALIGFILGLLNVLF